MSPLEVTLSPLPMLSSLERSHHAQPTPKEWGSRRLSLKVKYLYKINSSAEIIWSSFDLSLLHPGSYF